MNKSEITIVIILRILGIGGLFAIPAIFFPYSWMNAIHQYVGLGELPEVPIVDYLARSLSAFYAAVSAFTLFISFDIWRYRALIRFWGVVVVLMGLVLLGVDLTAGMSVAWTVTEGPPTTAIGVVVLWMQPFIESTSEKQLVEKTFTARDPARR